MAIAMMFARVCYGALFCVLLPLALVLVARNLDDAGIIGWPVPLGVATGFGLAGLGAALIAAAMLALWRIGGGLPMNAFPPPRRVAGGIYAVLAHPIYVGFVLLAAGVALILRSPSGFWLVTPLMALASASLVAGFEGPDLARRFGPSPAVLLSRPPNALRPLLWQERVIAGLLAFGPWALFYVLAAGMPAPSDAIDLRFAFEHALPRPALAWWPYSATYGFVLAAICAPVSARDGRHMVTGGWIIAVCGFAVMLLLPGRAALLPPSPGYGAEILAQLNRGLDADWLACPSFHVAWTVFAAGLLAARWPAARLAVWLIAAVLIWSAQATGSHAIVDLIGGGVVGALGLRHRVAAAGVLAQGQRVANSWHAVRIGPLRIANHALWSGLACGGASFLTLALTGGNAAATLVFLVISGLLAAILWARIIENGSRASRPFGYFGFMIGSTLVLGASALIRPGQAAVLAAALATAAPLAQAIGRLRCLVQGCCHGRPTQAQGIIVTNRMSRAVWIAGYLGVPLYPTQIMASAAAMALLPLQLKLWQSAAPWTVITGAYLVLGALARFVEEHFRGEPQTPACGGLSLYQWLSSGIFAIGLVLLALPGAAVPAMNAPGAVSTATAIGLGLLAALAMSVDWPGARAPLGLLAPSAPPEP